MTNTIDRSLFVIFLVCSTASAQNWIRADDIPATSVNSVIDHRQMMFAATDSALFRSIDGGDSWVHIPGPENSHVYNTLMSHSGILYLGTLGNGLFRSTDDGQTWSGLSSGLTGFAKNIAGIAVRGDSLYAATDGDGIYLLNLVHPQSWMVYNAGLFQFGSSSIITSGTTLVAAIGQYLFSRPQSAQQWNSVEIDSFYSRTPSRLFLFDSSIFLGTSGGIFRGTSDASHWKNADIKQFPNRQISSFARHESKLFASLNYQLNSWTFFSTDLGESWTVFAHEFAEVFAMHVSHERLWAGRSDGLWYFELGTVSGNIDDTPHLPSAFSLEQNFPNPFNPATTFSFTLPSRMFVSLTVTDLLGRTVATVLSEELPAGRHARLWNAAHLPSGLYVYRMSTPEYQSSKKLILLR